MAVIEINRDPSRKQLNQFGLVWMGFLSFFGAVVFFKFHQPTAATVLWILAAAVPIVGWIIPAFMRLVFLGMSYLAWPIGFVVSHVVLALVYYLVLTPIGLAMRVFGYDPMRREFDRSAESYWIARDTAETKAERYFRQF